jgi:hypothetical protein
MMPQVDEKSREITTVKYGPVTSNRIFSRKNRGLLIRERFAAQTLRHNGVYFGLFHAPVASQIFQRPEKNRLVLGDSTLQKSAKWAKPAKMSVISRGNQASTLADFPDVASESASEIGHGC